MFSFTLEDFFAVLKHYNLSIWPIQIFAYILGIVALFFYIKKTKYSEKIIMGILSFFWFWNGIIFCPIYWGPSYEYAYAFGALCIIQGLLFMWLSVKSDLDAGVRTNLQFVTGVFFIIYALAGYNILGLILNRVYPVFFPFGLIPCPTTIFTFGMFLVMKKKFPNYILIIPSIVAVVGILAVYKGIFEDIVLILSGITGTILLLQRQKKTADTGRTGQAD